MDIRRLIERAREHPIRRSKDTGRTLAAGQQPTALFITCADSRIVPAAITGAEPGSLFELRTAGNVIPEYRPDECSSEMATIEFAVVGLRVPEIIVCGHSHCGAVSALHGAALDHLPTMRGWLSRHHRLPEAITSIDPALRAEGQQHLLNQLRALETYPFIQDRVRAGELRVHGWFYDIETGDVLTPAAATAFGPL
ncbi:carbonic anhydrase [Crossiella cryophila]|uniref:Carbonic anhydrase n=1 Tax=Crossiella cryophila TaxID=43355 RepID=A0A7W7CHU8_9PSEU|nr:carbonic anhydrase [Crossiella cryophila]MBB4680041.1 carbonic anhydrase [Crossiella cryophila]